MEPDVEDPLAPPLLVPPLARACRVSLSIRPVALRPFDCWKSFKALLVFGPIFPSIGPGSNPAD